MNFLGLLLALVILVAILYQTVFTPAVGTHAKPKEDTTTLKALEAIKDAERLKESINNRNQDMRYEDRIKNKE